MNEHKMRQLLDEIRHVMAYAPPDLPLPQTQRCLVLPHLEWDAAYLESSVGVTLPPDLRLLWDRTSGLVLFEDITFGQWGLVVWSPDATPSRHRRNVARRRVEDFRRGDLIIGEFIGDTDLVVVRADAANSDFGSVMIALPMDPRDDWYRAAPSLGEFLRAFLDARGEKFWERRS